MRDSPRASTTTPNPKWEVQRLGFLLEVNMAEHTIALSGNMFECSEVSAAIANAATFLGKHLSTDWQVNVADGFTANFSGIAAFKETMSRFLVRCTYSAGFLALERAHEETADTERHRPRNTSLR